MDLILWRHAEAADAEPGQDDLLRELTPRGERQATRMAAWLNRHLTAGTRVIASPARRTQQTALALERKFHTVAAIAPDAPLQAVLEAARWPNAKTPVLVVGHQPTLGAVAALLLAGSDQPLAIRKGAVWWLRSRERDGEGQVTLVAALAPDQL